LIVEDEPLVMEALQGVVSTEYRTSCAATVREAYAFLRTSAVDLVLLDHRLADGTGDDIAALAETLGVSIITMSGYPHDESRSSRHPQLMKPFSAEMLLNKMRSVLEHRLIMSGHLGE
jgi:DNA-binding response OmpR family regulator